MKVSKAWTPLLLLLSATQVSASELLERLEIATELLGEKQGAFFVSRVPELKDKLPDWQWDEEIRQASGCVLTGIEEAKGKRVAEDYVIALEEDAKLNISSLNQLGKNIPRELQDDDSILVNLMKRCRTMEISVIRMRESGLWDAMNDPKTMSRLTAE